MPTLQDPIRLFLSAQGLNKTDIAVYLDIHKYGQSYASSVATRTGIDRTTVYSSLKRLLKRSVIVQTKMKDTLAYIAVSPSVFVDKLDRRIEDLTSEKRQAGLFVQEMLRVQRRTFLKPRTKIYEGVESVINLFMQTVEHSGEQKSFLSLAKIPDTLKDFLRKKYIELKVENDVASRVLVSDGPKAANYQSLDVRSNRTTKIIKKHPFDVHSEIILFNTREVALIDFHENVYGVLIESEPLFKSMEALFDYIWASE